MSRRLVLAALIVGGLACVVVGVQKMLDARAATDVVTAFLSALQRGDKQAVFSLLDPARRIAVEAEAAARPGDFWAPQTGMTYRIHHLDIAEGRAEAQLWIEKQGFVIQPIVRLRRGDTNTWKIVDVDNLFVDPLWQNLEQARARQQGEELASELGKALEGRTGVTVSREAIDESLR